MAHLKQHVFNAATDVCLYCGAERQEEHLPCDHALKSAPDYFDWDDPRWQAEESENPLRPCQSRNPRSTKYEAHS
jgi:hypothetical protein